jgi:hypothetical protein
MKKVTLRKRDMKKTQYFIECPFCNNEISGTSKEHLLSNLEMHLFSKHKEEKRKVEVKDDDRL